jgi:membrane-bound metal-dependent hydrolase YbcI (DUF457 family)
MPITPFHLGPGAICKAAAGRHFSFMVYGGTQVLMDIEPLIGIIQRKPVLHGYTHTILGALVIGTLAGIVGRPISACVLRVFRIPHYPFTWTACFVAAYFGAFSHVMLDALMHSDMNPWWPIASGNQLLGVMPLWSIHAACAVTGVIGALIVAGRFAAHGRA